MGCRSGQLRRIGRGAGWNAPRRHGYIALQDGMGATLPIAPRIWHVYALEVFLLLVTLVVLGPVIGLHLEKQNKTNENFGLSGSNLNRSV
jgi:hypothetical protein